MILQITKNINNNQKLFKLLQNLNQWRPDDFLKSACSVYKLLTIHCEFIMHTTQNLSLLTFLFLIELELVGDLIKNIT